MNAEQLKAALDHARDMWEDYVSRNGSEIPDYTLDSLHNYLFEGVPVGDFLRAVLDDKLFEAIGRADSANLKALPKIVGLIYNVFPMVSKSYGKWLEIHEDNRAVMVADEFPTYPTNAPARDSRSEHDPSL